MVDVLLPQILNPEVLLADAEVLERPGESLALPVGAGEDEFDEEGSGGSEMHAAEADDSEEARSEARLRLLAGLKRYFHSKRAEGLLSGMVRGSPAARWSVTSGFCVQPHLKAMWRAR